MTAFWKSLSLAVIACVVVASSASRGVGQEFRIATRVFVDDAEEPQSESLTLYHSGVVYDFLLTSPNEIAIFKKSAGDKAGRFILMDPTRKLKTELSTDEVLHFLTELQRNALVQKDPLLKFAAEPKFTEDFDAASGQLVLSSSVMNYRLQTEPAKSPTDMAAYREYCDWFARLNARTHPGSLPPSARLAVNQALANYEATAKEVVLTLPTRRGFQSKDMTVRAAQQLDWRLSKDDLDRIEKANLQLVNFKETEFSAYRPPAP